MDTLANINPIYEFDAAISGDNRIELHPSETKIIEVLLYNNGNKKDRYQVELLVDPPWEEQIKLSSTNVSIEKSSYSILIVTIDASKSMKFDTYPFKIKFTSIGSLEKNETKTELLSFNIDYSEKEEEPLSFDTILLWLGIIIAIMVVIIVIFVVSSRIKIKKFQQELTRSKSTPTKKPISKPVKGTPGKITKDGEVAEVVYEPEHSKAVDRRGKSRKVYDGRKKN
jgi:hypothetical protein